jgi:FlaA1/EpsC-like NDP-sugar epimerase
LVRRLIDLPPRARAASLLAVDALVVAVVTYGVLALRLGEPLPAPLLASDRWYLAAVLLITLPVFWLFRLYQALVRYGGQWILMLVTRAVSLAVGLLVPVALMLGSPAFPLSVLPLLWGGLLLSILASRLILYWGIKKALDDGRRGRRERIAIYGAGRAGVQILAALRSSLDHKVVCLFDDDDRLHGRHILGSTIFDPAKLERVVAERQVKRIILAMPSAGAARRREILERIGELAVKVQTLPPLSEIIDCRVEISQIRDVSPEELLWRPPVEPRSDLLGRDVTGKNVMVTGGGGSIGSELCRQILPLGPTRLVVYELSELALYDIEQELRALVAKQGWTVALDFVLGDVGDGLRLRTTLEAHAIETLYHAAAFKHVPIVEANPLPGILNNAFGTLCAAQSAQAAGVAKFVLISTDKAVRPTNVMGASKRLAEMVLQALTTQGGATLFAMVRFGNVINSTGSVVPLFRRQIAAGGPVTVTHRDVVRYFMTIPEAANLVLQAGALAEGGEVFLLDMGEPVRIHDLARRLIHLSGFTVRDTNNPDGDIPIVITGLRPGEKLFEELFIGADVQPTPHKRILKAHEDFLSWPELTDVLDQMRAAAARGDSAVAVDLLRETIRRTSRPEPQVASQAS